MGREALRRLKDRDAAQNFFPLGRAVHGAWVGAEGPVRGPSIFWAWPPFGTEVGGSMLPVWGSVGTRE